MSSPAPPIDIYPSVEIDWMHLPSLVQELSRLEELAYPGSPNATVCELVPLVASWFKGKHPLLQANDTCYHDIDHTLQVLLCWVRLMTGRALAQDTPVVSFDLYRLGLVAVLLHDIGYLKERGDDQGTGAKYTHIHEERGCKFVAKELPALGFSASEIGSIQRFIRCTGPQANLSAIQFISQAERFVGLAVCTADYIGQMSDPEYVRKLPCLFREFQESDEFRVVPMRDRLFQSAEDLLAKTHKFWGGFVVPRLENDCCKVYRWLAAPAPGGANPYWKKILVNLDKIQPC
jgi:hypothetical protein